MKRNPFKDKHGILILSIKSVTLLENTFCLFGKIKKFNFLTFFFISYFTSTSSPSKFYYFNGESKIFALLLNMFMSYSITKSLNSTEIMQQVRKSLLTAFVSGGLNLLSGIETLKKNQGNKSFQHSYQIETNLVYRYRTNWHMVTQFSLKFWHCSFICRCSPQQQTKKVN